MELEMDIWQGNRMRTETIEEPSAQDVRTALRTLDQREHTEFTVQRDGGDYISVGGGLGKYHVYIGSTMHDDTFTLRDPAAGDEEVELVTGGQLGRFPASSVADAEQAERAVLSFIRDGRPDPTLTWDAE